MSKLKTLKSLYHTKMTFNPTLKVQALSKREASKLTPPDRALLISIQDGEKSHLPFKQRTNHITRDKYVATLFTYFDDVQEELNPFAFGVNDARQIINFLNRHFQKPGNFDRIIVHCQAGVSRSQAVALFITKYYYRGFKGGFSIKGNMYLVSNL